MYILHDLKESRYIYYMSDQGKQSVADMRKRCKGLVDGGNKDLKGYSKLSRAELTSLMGQLDNADTGKAIAEESEPIVLPVAAAKAITSTEAEDVAVSSKVSKSGKTKRAPSQWNKFCKDNKIAPGSPISQAQKDAYASHKASLSVSA